MNGLNTVDMQKENKRIPIHGSMTRPANPDDAITEVHEGKVLWSGGNLIVSFSTDEFTSVCPTTGQPDFNTIEVKYKPKKFYAESKTLKYYLWSFREHGAHCEPLSKKIAEDIKSAIDAEWVEAVVNQNPRGGIRIISRYKT